MSFGKNIRGALSYNEQKVINGDATLILASGFSCDISDLGFTSKQKRFEKNNSLRPKTKTNTLHISLNFSPDDPLSDEGMQLIAKQYMEQIGFGDQPYIVYRHTDTKHPHIHIVTNTIRDNGEAIYLHELAKRVSEPARQQLEKDYGLVVAQGRNQVTDKETLSTYNGEPIYTDEGTKGTLKRLYKDAGFT